MSAEAPSPNPAPQPEALQPPQIREAGLTPYGEGIDLRLHESHLRGIKANHIPHDDVESLLENVDRGRELTGGSFRDDGTFDKFRNAPRDENGKIDESKPYDGTPSTVEILGRTRSVLGPKRQRMDRHGKGLRKDEPTRHGRTMARLADSGGRASTYDDESYRIVRTDSSGVEHNEVASLPELLHALGSTLESRVDRTAIQQARLAKWRENLPSERSKIADRVLTPPVLAARAATAAGNKDAMAALEALDRRTDASRAVGQEALATTIDYDATGFHTLNEAGTELHEEQRPDVWGARGNGRARNGRRTTMAGPNAIQQLPDPVAIARANVADAHTPAQPDVKDVKGVDDPEQPKITKQYADELIEKHRSGDLTHKDTEELKKLAAAIQSDTILSGGYTIPGTDEWIPGKQKEQYFFKTLDGRRIHLDDKTVENLRSLLSPEDDKQPKPSYEASYLNVLDVLRGLTSGRTVVRSDDEAVVVRALDALNSEDSELKGRIVDQLKSDDVVDYNGALMISASEIYEVQKNVLESAVENKANLVGVHYTAKNGTLLKIIKQNIDDKGDVTYKVESSEPRDTYGPLVTTWKRVKPERLVEELRKTT